MNKDIVLAFSGGLDTSFCVPYLQERGWNVHVHGLARPFHSATQAITTLYAESDMDDQYLPEFVVVERPRIDHVVAVPPM